MAVTFSTQHIKVNDIEMSFNALLNFYVYGILRRSEGVRMNGIEIAEFIQCRSEIKHRIDTLEWVLMGLDTKVINVLMQTGDKLLTDGNVVIALNFYREAVHLFPAAAICNIREAQCLVALGLFDQAKKACRKAIHLSDEYDFEELLSVIDTFTKCDKLQEAHGLYLTLIDRFPHHYCFLGKVKGLEVLLKSKEEQERAEKERKIARNRSDGCRKKAAKKVGQTSDKKLDQASGGVDPSLERNVTQTTVIPKVEKTSKQLKREQMARDKEIKQEIEKAAKEQEERFKKQQEMEASKRKLRQEKEEMMRIHEEVEAHKRKEREEKVKMLRKQEEEARKKKEQDEREKEMKIRNEEIKKQQEKTKNEHIRKKSSKSSSNDEVMGTNGKRSKNSSTNVVAPKKVSLNDMPTDHDHLLSTGSHLRRICSSCNAPRVFSASSCKSCKSELVVWYRKVNTTIWSKPRMPPNPIVFGRYVQCKHFKMGKSCVKTPCKFAHGQDELEIWELCRVKGNRCLKERETSDSTLQKSRSCVSLDGHDFGTKLRSRTDSLSSLRSVQSSSNRFDLLNSGDMLDEFDSDSEYSSFLSQDVFEESSLDSAGPFSSSLSLNIDMDISPTSEDLFQSSATNMSTTPLETEESDDGWTEVRRQKKPEKSIILSNDANKRKKGKSKKKSKTRSSGSTTNNRQDLVSIVMKQEELRCNFCDIKFSSMSQLQFHYSGAEHRVNAMKRTQQLHVKSTTEFRPPPDGVYMGRYKLCHRFEKGRCYFGNKCTFAHGAEECAYWIALYERQSQHLEQLQKKQLLTDSFSEKVRRRIKCEDALHVLKEDLPGVTVNCSSPWKVKLDGPQSPHTHVWIFDVRIQTKYQLLLNQVAFLLETHLDKFKFLRSPSADRSSNMESIQLREEDFVEDSGKQQSAVQFCVQFSSGVFGEFEQKLVFDFGHGSVLVRSLFASVVSKDICSSDKDTSRTVYCCILEWSEEKVELVLCKDLSGLDLDGLSGQYGIPHVLPNPSKLAEFKHETYCKLWHDILFIEEKHVRREVARYDIRNGAMTIVNSFQNSDQEMVFAQPGELFGQIFLSDYLVMDEVAGHIINRSVMSVILRLKLGQVQSQRVYECSIKMKTSQLVIIKLNAVLCNDYVFQKDQVICIDLKFRYNRLPMCEMHQAIDMCRQKVGILLPTVKNVSYKHKKSIPDWFMDRKPNTNQHEAIAMILDPNPTPPILVIGPFGTGKTFTLNLASVSILSQYERNKVLICTHSNSAANIHLEHLDAKIRKKPSLRIRPLRVLDLFRKIQTVNPERLRKYCLIEETTNAIREPTWEEIRDHNVVITTLVTSRMLWKFYQDGRLRFTHILVDEAAQALEPECVTPLVMADGNTKIVLAGDHKQIGASSYSKFLWPEDLGPKRSLLERLFTHYEQNKKTSSQPCSSSETSSTFLQTPYVILLTENYRSHATILEFPSDCFYGGELVSRGDQSTHSSIPVLSFYTAQGADRQDKGSLAYYNEAEVAEVVKQVKELTDLWPKHWGEMNIGVLTPYRDQVKRIREGLRKKGLSYINVETVENVQGKEFKALFISTVRTMWTCSEIERRNLVLNSDLSELDFGFLSDPRLLNTAVTRAQSLLAVVGDPMSLCSVGACRNLWKDYLQRCHANKGLYGCTLKTVMDFCLGTQPLDPSAHEFLPSESPQAGNGETATSSISKGGREVSSVENGVGFESEISTTELDKGSISISCSPISTSVADQTRQPVSVSVANDKEERILVDRNGDCTADNQTSNARNVADNEDGNVQDDSETGQSATDIFFHLDGSENYDKIIEELIKACQETKKKDDGWQEKATDENFPSLNHDAPTTSTTSHWPNISFKRTFSAGLKDGRIELGFHVKDSDRLFRLTGGNLLPKEKGDNQSGHDIDASPEELLKLLAGNPARFAKCSYRVDTSIRPPGYCGHVPAPDTPDIKIPGRVRGVYEDDVVVLELQPDARTQDDEGQRKETVVLGYIKGILRRQIEPRERQFVCTVDRANRGMMIPINKKSPKLANFTKTDEDIIPIYTFKNGDVTRAKILSERHHGEALAGERVFVVKYLKWRSDCPHPLGLAVRHIPHGKDFETGMEILYEEHNVRRKFDQELRRNVTREFNENWQVPTSEKGRPVYSKNVFTVDPPDSLDLDDAISVQSLGNGNFNVQVHIADVSYFVKPNTKLDEEARLRGTSYYPPKPEVTVPMLPPELSEGCCSLLQGEDRLAVTVSCELKPDGTDVGDVRIERSLVRSTCRLTYREAQQIIDETSQQDLSARQEEGQVPVKEAIGIIYRIAQGRRRLRLGVERSLYSRQRDDCNEGDENEQDAHQMIEELMIMTNHLVAKYLLRKFSKRTPLRVQPPPKDSRLAEWRKRFHKFVNFSLELKLIGDIEKAQEETIDLKVPFKTWTMIMSQVKEDSNFPELVKLVCDLDLFPQLALANLKQQLMQQRSQYICSGETFENISLSWPQFEIDAPPNEQTARADGSLEVLDDNVSLSEDKKNLPKAAEDSIDDETNSENTNTANASDDISAPSCSSLDEGNRCSVDVSNQGNLNSIFYGHSSLCLDAYCHFTSPIRRYIDIIVHRLVVSGIENENNTMESDDITTLCDRCTFFVRNSGRFEKEAKKLQLAVSLQGSFRFVSAFIEEIEPDALRLFFGTGKFEILNSKSVRIARLGPDKDPEEADGQINLQWTFRVLRLDQQGRAQPRLPISDDEESKALVKKLESQSEDEVSSNTSEVPDDFDYVVTAEQWSGVLEAVKNQDQDQLKSQLQKVDDDVQKQKKPGVSTNISLLKRLNNDPSLSSNAPYQPPNVDRPESNEEETDEFLKVTRSFKPFDRVKVQICSQMNRGLLSPTIQLFKLTDKIHACVEHRNFPTTCFAKTSHKRPTNTEVSDITEYVQLWKPVLMMEIATSAVRENDALTLSNLCVSLVRDPKGLVKMRFELSYDYCAGHFLDPLDLNLMCVRIKDPDGTGKDTGYWVGHFQISEESRKKEDARKSLKEIASARKEQDVSPIESEVDCSLKKEEESSLKDHDTCPALPTLSSSTPLSGLQDEKKTKEGAKKKSNLKKNSEYRPVVARLIHSSSPVPESLITQGFCYATVELIFLSVPDRRRLGALVDSVVATELVQDICIGKVPAECDVEESSIPENLSLCNVYHSLPNFYPLNRYQRRAVQTALTQPFTLIQGPPGTGKTVTGVHIAYWFAQLNRKRKLAEKKEGKEHSGSMVFYCGPSNKSVDVVARYLIRIPDVKILRIYGQEIERKIFPVPDKVTLFRSKRVAVQLKADEDLKDVSLHHVIRSAESPFAEMLKEYDEEFKHYTGYNSNAPRKVIDDFNKIKSEAEKWAITQRGVNVILATCTSAYSNRILTPCEGFISQCIIDECGMCIEAETLCAMLGSNAKQVVLIGDHKQLQPVIQCDKAKDLGLGISMFERFSERAQMLEIQYRMHENLCQFPSDFFYDGKLKTAHEVRARKPDKVIWPNGNSYPFEFHHVEGVEESLVVSTDQGNENSKKNKKEINKVIYVARRLTNDGIKGEDIVVLSPYRAQCFEITEKLEQHGLKNISVMSVVAAQGSEKNYVILSLVRSLPRREIERNPSRSWLMEKLGFITDDHQINVALTRAKRGLCIIGNANLIGACSMWRALLEHYKNKGCLLMDAR